MSEPCVQVWSGQATAGSCNLSRKLPACLLPQREGGGRATGAPPPSLPRVGQAVTGLQPPLTPRALGCDTCARAPRQGGWSQGTHAWAGMSRRVACPLLFQPPAQQSPWGPAGRGQRGFRGRGGERGQDAKKSRNPTPLPVEETQQQTNGPRATG